MTDGEDLDAVEDQGLENPGSDEVDVGRDADEGDDDDESDDVPDDEGTGDGEADAPAGVDVNPNQNDDDPTAGASDIGGLAGGANDT